MATGSALKFSQHALFPSLASLDGRKRYESRDIPPASPHTCPVITSAPSSPLCGLPHSCPPQRCPMVACHPASLESIAPKSPACLLAALLSKGQLAPPGPLSLLLMETTLVAHGVLHPTAMGSMPMGPLAFPPFLLSPLLLLMPLCVVRVLQANTARRGFLSSAADEDATR